MDNMMSMSDLFGQTDELITWLERKGITTANRSRVSKYRSLAEEFFNSRNTSEGWGFIFYTDRNLFCNTQKEDRKIDSIKEF